MNREVERELDGTASGRHRDWIFGLETRDFSPDVEVGTFLGSFFLGAGCQPDSKTSGPNSSVLVNKAESSSPEAVLNSFGIVMCEVSKDSRSKVPEAALQESFQQLSEPSLDSLDKEMRAKVERIGDAILATLQAQVSYCTDSQIQDLALAFNPDGLPTGGSEAAPAYGLSGAVFSGCLMRNGGGSVSFGHISSNINRIVVKDGSGNIIRVMQNTNQEAAYLLKLATAAYLCPI